MGGDRQAHEMLFERFSSPLFRVACRYVRQSVDAEDVLIMAYTKAFANLDKFTYRGDGSLEAWLRKVVINEALMWLRRRQSLALREVPDEGINYVELDTFSELPAEDIVRFIQELPDGYRTVFNLYVVEGYTHAEIAELLNINESTSRTQLHKAKQLLKKKLSQEGFHYGT